MGNNSSFNHKRAKVSLNEKQLEEIFWNHDKDKDGKLTREELMKGFTFLDNKYKATFRVDEALRAADINGDGVISSQEMNKLIAYAKSRNYINP